MSVNVPRVVESVANDPRDMVRVQFSERDVRSYTRLEAEKLIATGTVPGAFIVGDPPAAAATDVTEVDPPLRGEGATFEEAAEDLKSKAAAKAQRSAPNNKARQPKAAEPDAKPPAVETKTVETDDTTASTAETTGEPPAVETKAE